MISGPLKKAKTAESDVKEAGKGELDGANQQQLKTLTEEIDILREMLQKSNDSLTACQVTNLTFFSLNYLRAYKSCKCCENET